MDIEIAKEILKGIDIKFFLNGMTEQSNYIVDKADEINIAIDTVLSELEKKDKRLNRQFKLLQKRDKEIEELKADNSHQWEERCKLTFELEKKDKIINEMAKWLYEDDTSFGYGNLKSVNTPEKIKQYFERKVEGK